MPLDYAFLAAAKHHIVLNILTCTLVERARKSACPTFDCEKALHLELFRSLCAGKYSESVTGQCEQSLLRSCWRVFETSSVDMMPPDSSPRMA